MAGKRTRNLGRRRLPAAPLIPLLTELLTVQDQAELAQLTGVPERRFYAVLSGEQVNVAVDTADAIITRTRGPEIFTAMYGAEVDAMAAELLGEPV